jgi:hypothetical protein
MSKKRKEESAMKKLWIGVLAPPAIVLFVWIFGEVVMHLWNWLLPSLFGWRVITFWQALGLLVLCRILFGGFGGHGNQNGHRRRVKGEGWSWRTPEEREKFCEELRARCGGMPAADSASRESA